MALILVACVLIAGRARADDPGKQEDEATKKELALLQGSWAIVGKEYSGKKATEEEVAQLAEVTITVEGAKVEWSQNQEKKEIISEATIKLDPKAKPKALDITFTSGRFKGDSVLAIYEVSGDALKVCYSTEDGKGRPTEFAGKADGKAIFMNYKRAKK
jgi:uncharacterized protein (TIGR03067 family)